MVDPLIPPNPPIPGPPVPIVVPPAWRAWTVPAFLLGGAVAAGFLLCHHFSAPVIPVDPPEPDMSAIIQVKAPTAAMTMVKLPPGLSPDSLQWFQPPAEAAKVQVLQYLDHVVVCPQVDGVYDLAATSFAGGKFTMTVWRITAGKGPIPPPPGPEPTPIPPEPIPPAPTPSALQKSLQAAYALDTDLDKAAKVVKFAEILENAATMARKAGNLKTAKDFTTMTHNATVLAIGKDSIPNVRKAVGAYLVTVLPTLPTTPANEAYFAKVDSEHGFVALTLRGLR